LNNCKLSNSCQLGCLFFQSLRNRQSAGLLELHSQRTQHKRYASMYQCGDCESNLNHPDLRAFSKNLKKTPPSEQSYLQPILIRKHNTMRFIWTAKGMFLQRMSVCVSGGKCRTSCRSNPSRHSWSADGYYDYYYYSLNRFNYFCLLLHWFFFCLLVTTNYIFTWESSRKLEKLLIQKNK